MPSGSYEAELLDDAPSSASDFPPAHALAAAALAAEQLNFGDFIALPGVNPAAFTRNWLHNIAPPLLGFLICLSICLAHRPAAKLTGSV